VASNSRYAASQLARKLRLEAQFRSEVLKWFRSINATLRPIIAHTGQMPDIAHFRDDLTMMLRKHYVRVGRSFKGDVQSDLGKSLQFMETKQQAEVSGATTAAIINWSAERAPEQAGYIMDTTQNDLQDIQTAAQEQQPPSNAALAALIASAFTSTFAGRADAIASTETQAAAETSKKLEADSVADVAQTESEKVWHTVLDTHTRFSHVLANLQRQDRPQPFTVGGYLMPIPGDTSLGAPVSEVIHCRCSAEYCRV